MIATIKPAKAIYTFTIFLMMSLVWLTACQPIAQPNNQAIALQETTPLIITPTSTQTAIVIPTATSPKTPTRQSTPFLISTPTPTGCEVVGQWETYTDPVAGYSLQYPAEAELRESSVMDEDYRAISIFLKPDCYDINCWGPTKIGIFLEHNPDELLVQDFVAQHYRLYSNPSHQNSLKNYEESSYFITISGVQSLRIELGLGSSAQPDIFIPHGNRIIHIQVSYPGRTTPPYDPPCDQVLTLLGEILTSITLLP